MLLLLLLLRGREDEEEEDDGIRRESSIIASRGERFLAIIICDCIKCGLRQEVDLGLEAWNSEQRARE